MRPRLQPLASCCKADPSLWVADALWGAHRVLVATRRPPSFLISRRGSPVVLLIYATPNVRAAASRSRAALIEPSEVAEAVMFILTRPRNVTIRDIVVLPSNFDI